MNTVSPRAMTKVSTPLAICCLLLCCLAGCTAQAPLVESYDFIASFEESQGRLSRQEIVVRHGDQLLESGFAKRNQGRGVVLNADLATLRFDSPWIRGAGALALSLRAKEPCRVRVTLNGQVLNPAEVSGEFSNFSWALQEGDLQRQNNRLTLEAPPTACLRLASLTLPPTSSTVLLDRRRIPFLPAPPPSSLSYRLRPAPGSRLSFETVCKFSTRGPPGEAVVFEVLNRANSTPQTLFRREVPLQPAAAAGISEPAEIDLTPLAGQELELVFITRYRGESRRPFSGDAGWGNPRLLPAERTSDTSPSLIIWLTDTLRADHLGCYGYRHNTSPHLDRFASEAILFENFLSQSSWTKSSIATIFTGLNASYHGAVGREDKLLPQVTTMAELFREAGYNTAAFSSNAYFFADYWGLTKGFEEVWSYYPSNHFEDSQAIIEDLLPWISARTGNPFFLFVHTRDPHDPYLPPRRFANLFPHEPRTAAAGGGNTAETAAAPDGVTAAGSGPGMGDPGWDPAPLLSAYDGEIAYNDEFFKRFILELQRAGLYDPSLLVYLSDHGEEFHDHGGWRHGHQLFQEQIRIPLIIRLPRGKHGNRTVRGATREVDLLPSLLQWAGLECSTGQGESFSGLVEAGEDPAPLEILSEQTLDSAALYSITAGRYKYILRLEPDREELLFDMVADPAESFNLLAEQPELAATLAGRIASYREIAETGTRILFISAKKRTAIGKVVGNSPFRMVNGINLGEKVAGRSFGLSDDRRTIWFRINTAGEPGGLVFDLERPDLGAVLTLQTSRTGPGWPVFLGARTEAEKDGPLHLMGDELLVPKRTVASLSGKPDGCHIWRVPGGAEQGPSVLSEEELENLRGLGYIE